MNLSVPGKKGYFNREIRNPANGEVVKITANSPKGPFYVRLHTDYGKKYTDKNSKLMTLSAAYKWAQEHLKIAVHEGELDTGNGKMYEIQDGDEDMAPGAHELGTDRLFSY